MAFRIGDKNITITVSTTQEDFFTIFGKIHDINNIYNFINEQPLYPEWREKIKNMEFIRAVQGTVALEGTDITVEDVERVAEASRGKEMKTFVDKEAANALAAYEFISEWSYENAGEPITDSVIRQIHTILTRDLNYYLNEPGQYRNQIVKFGMPEQKSILRDRFEVEETMNELVKLINTKTKDYKSLLMSPITRAVIAHYLITLIHPFIDGNGRVARALEALILHHCGKYEPYFFPITTSYYYKERKKYFELLRRTDETGNPIPLVLFAIEGLNAYLVEIKNSILDQITRTLIMDYAHQLRRQKKILKRQITLLENAFRLDPMELSEFIRHPAIRGIYLNLSESTRKRDMANLVSVGLLKITKTRPPGGQERVEVSVNWDALKSLTLSLDKIPHRPEPHD